MLTPEPIDAANRARRRHGRALIVVLAVAATLRFTSISQVGIRFDDEASYAADARLWHRCARLLVDPQAMGAVIRGDKAGVQSRMATLGIDFADRYDKPSQGFTFPAAAMMFLVGDDPTALVVLNALCGTLSVWILYQLGFVMFGRSIALLAAALLAVSPYHVTYCRSAFPYATATMFVLLGVWWWSKPRSGPCGRRYLVLSGAALGCATSCHYSALGVAGMLMAFELVHRPTPRGGEFSAGSFAHAGRRCGVIFVGLMIPILMIEGIFQSARLAARVTDSFLPVITYFEAFIEWAGVIAFCGVRPAGVTLLNWTIPAVYTGYFTHWHGAVGSVTLMAGLCVVLLRGRGRARIPAIIVTGTVGLLMLQRYMIPRAAAMIVPFACLCIAVALRALAGSWPRLVDDSEFSESGCPPRIRIEPATPSGAANHVRRWCRPLAAWVLASVLLVSLIPGLTQVVGPRSALAQACSFVTENGGGRVIVPVDSCNQSKYALYLDSANTDIVRRKLSLFGTPDEVLSLLRDEGARWMITDPQHYHYPDLQRTPGGVVYEWWRNMHDYLDGHAELVVEFDHQAGNRWEFLAEGTGLRFLPEMVRRNDGTLKIYDLQSATPRWTSRSSRRMSAIMSE